MYVSGLSGRSRQASNSAMELFTTVLERSVGSELPPAAASASGIRTTAAPDTGIGGEAVAVAVEAAGVVK